MRQQTKKNNTERIKPAILHRAVKKQTKKKH